MEYTMDDRTDDIIRIATSLRAKIDRLDKRTFPQYFTDFPRGCCEATSFILGEMLQNEGHTGFQLKCARYFVDGKFHSHAWLQRGDLVVDITADQAPIISEPVIVSTSSLWHNSQEDTELKSWQSAWQYSEHSYLEGISQFRHLIYG